MEFRLFFAPIILMTFFTAATADVITIRSDIWFPINGDPDSATPGYMIELAETIFKKAGHTIDYKPMPWERSLIEVRRGNFDCVVGVYLGDAPDFIFPTAS